MLHVILTLYFYYICSSSFLGKSDCLDQALLLCFFSIEVNTYIHVYLSFTITRLGQHVCNNIKLSKT